MTLLNTMSVIIACGNISAGLLTGQAVVVLRRAAYRFHSGHELSPSFVYAWTRQAQGIGWVALFAAQAFLVVFGFTAGYVGFKFVQPLLIPIAAANFVVWLHQGYVRAARGETQ